MTDPLLDPASYRVIDNVVRCILPGYVSFGEAVLEGARAAGVSG